MHLISGICLAICFSPLVFCSQAFDEDAVDRVLADSLKCRAGQNPGFAVSVVQDGKVVFSRGYGLVDPDRPDLPVTEHTLFGIASVSKSFAATLLIKLLYENTNLTVDSTVRELLGSEFQMADDYRTQETTFADLMAHRTATLPNNKIRFNRNFTRANILKRLPLLEAPRQFQFRVKYMYSNLIYGLVTRLAEIVGKDSWEDLIQNHLYDKLGMVNSSFATTLDFSREDVAKGVEQDKFDEDNYLRVAPEFSKHWANLAGSGAIMSTARDMTKWMKFHLSQGKNEQNEQVMEEDALAEVQKGRFYISTTSSKETRFPTFPATSTENIYCQGLRSGFYRGYHRLTHTGSTLGYRSQMSLLPDKNIGVFIGMTGGDDSFLFRTATHLYLLDMALGVEPWLNASTLCSFPQPWKRRKASSSLKKLDNTIPLKKDVTEYEGTYHNRGFGYIHVVYNQTMHGLMMTYGWGSWQLYPTYKEGKDDDKFYGQGLGINNVYRINPLEFLQDPNNASAIRELKIAGFESRYPPVFVKESYSVDDDNDGGDDDDDEDDQKNGAVGLSFGFHYHVLALLLMALSVLL